MFKRVISLGRNGGLLLMCVPDLSKGTACAHRADSRLGTFPFPPHGIFIPFPPRGIQKYCIHLNGRLCPLKNTPWPQSSALST